MPARGNNAPPFLDVRGAGGGRGSERMDDADTRITNDAKICVDQIAKTFADALYAATALLVLRTATTGLEVRAGGCPSAS